jgi:hypothetical protein
MGAKLSAPVQTGPGAHPTSNTMGTGSFPGIKRPERGIDHQSPSSAEVKEGLELEAAFEKWWHTHRKKISSFDETDKSI